jgi:isopentenyl phosphate kinase
VKLGGSIITDTKKADTALPGEIDRLVKEIKSCTGNARVVVGHGSGSFGHMAAHRYGFQNGVYTKDRGKGASITQKAASELHRHVIGAMLANGIDALSFPPSAGGLTTKRRLVRWNIEPIRLALKMGFTPVVRGDVTIDTVNGITIIPTEEPLRYLTAKLKPDKVIVASDTDGVFTANPLIDKDAELIRRIDRRNIKRALAGTGGSLKVDVTGGMRNKLIYLYGIARRYGTTCQIINAKVPGRLKAALQGREVRGTIITA